MAKLGSYISLCYITPRLESNSASLQTGEIHGPSIKKKR